MRFAEVDADGRVPRSIKNIVLSSIDGDPLMMALGPTKQVLDHDVELGACAFQGTVAAHLGALPFDAAIGLALIEFRR